MNLKIARFTSLFLTGLGTGIAFSHLLQWSKKATFPRDVFLKVQPVLYNNYGPAAGIMEPATLVSTLAVLYQVRKRPLVFLLTLISLLCTVTTVLVWALFIRPINNQVVTWTEETAPANWAQWGRDRWHFLHAIRFAIAALGTSVLISSILLDKLPAAQENGAGRYAHLFNKALEPIKELRK